MLTMTAAINEQNRTVVHIRHRMAFHRIQIPMQDTIKVKKVIKEPCLHTDLVLNRTVVHMYMAPYQSKEGGIVNVQHSLHNWYNVCSVPWTLWMAFMFIIRNAHYQWLLYIPHYLLELSSTAFGLLENTTFSSSQMLTWSSSSLHTHT